MHRPEQFIDVCRDDRAGADADIFSLGRSPYRMQARDAEWGVRFETDSLSNFFGYKLLSKLRTACLCRALTQQ